MPASINHGLDELRAQARRTYRYWPVYLMLRLREVEQHLTASQRAELGLIPGQDTPVSAMSLPATLPSHGRLALLIEYGLLADNVIPFDTHLESISLPDAEAYVFRAGAALIESRLNKNFVSLDFVVRHRETVMGMELLRTTDSYHETTSTAAEIFNRMMADLSAGTAFDAAHYYAAIHGARQADWKAVPSQILSQYLPEMPVLNEIEVSFQPRRRRGRGVFRTPV